MIVLYPTFTFSVTSQDLDGAYAKLGETGCDDQLATLKRALEATGFKAEVRLERYEQRSQLIQR